MGTPDISLIHRAPAPFDRPAFLLYRAAMTSRKPNVVSSPTAGKGVVIDRAADVLTFTLDNSSHGNEVTGVMFDAMLAELRKDASKPPAPASYAFGRAATFFARDASARAAPLPQSAVN